MGAYGCVYGLQKVCKQILEGVYMGASGCVFVPLAAGIGHRKQTEHRFECGSK